MQADLALAEGGMQADLALAVGGMQADLAVGGMQAAARPSNSANQLALCL